MGMIQDTIPPRYIKTISGKQLFTFHSMKYIGASGSPYMNNHCNAVTCLTLVKGGRGQLFLSGRKYPVGTGDLVILRGMEPHYFRAVSESDTLEIIDVSFHLALILEVLSEFIDGSIARILLSLDKQFQNLLDRRNPMVQEIARLILVTEQDFLTESPDLSVVRTRFLEILALTARAVSENRQDPAGSTAKYENLIAYTIEYISHNLADDLTLDVLARQAAMEKNHYIEVFKSIHGISPWNFVVHARIEHAMRLLKDTGCYYSVTEIASRCGFRNLSNFNRTFKSRTGMTPSEYRKNASAE